MIKKTACLLATLTLAACAADRTKNDWATDCERNSSENPAALADCKAALPNAEGKAPKDRPIEHTLAGPKGKGYKDGDKSEDAAQVE